MRTDGKDNCKVPWSDSTHEPAHDKSLSNGCQQSQVVTKTRHHANPDHSSKTSLALSHSLGDFCSMPHLRWGDDLLIIVES
jgi:hypothetical protein